MKKSNERETKSEPRHLEDLRGVDWNPRRIEERALTGLEASIEKFGDLACLVWNRGTKKTDATPGLICGNQRRQALMRLMESGAIEWGEIYETKRGPERDGTLRLPDGSRFRVREVDWDDRTERAANLAANNSAIQGKFSDELDVILESLRSNPADDGELYSMLLLDELESKEPSNTITLIPTDKPPPKLGWALIGMPIEQFGKVQSVLDELKEEPGIHIETSASDGTEEKR